MGISCEYIKIFSAYSEKSNLRCTFGNIANFAGPQNVLFITASFRNIFQKESVVKSLYRRAAVCTMDAFNLKY